MPDDKLSTALGNWRAVNQAVRDEAARLAAERELSTVADLGRVLADQQAPQPTNEGS